MSYRPNDSGGGIMPTGDGRYRSATPEEVELYDEGSIKAVGGASSERAADYRRIADDGGLASRVSNDANCRAGRHDRQYPARRAAAPRGAYG
jgi:hypothetical protein